MQPEGPAVRRHSSHALAASPRPLARTTRTRIEIDFPVWGKPGGNPEPGDRLRFVFVFVSCVACVRAGEAKLRVRARCRVFLLGRPRRREVVLRSRPLREAQDVVYTWVLMRNGSKSGPRCSHCMCFTWVLSRCFIKPVCGACFLGRNSLKPVCGAYLAARIFLKPVSSTASEGKSSAKPL